MWLLCGSHTSYRGVFIYTVLGTSDDLKANWQSRPGYENAELCEDFHRGKKIQEPLDHKITNQVNIFMCALHTILMERRFPQAFAQCCWWLCYSSTFEHLPQGSSNSRTGKGWALWHSSDKVCFSGVDYVSVSQATPKVNTDWNLCLIFSSFPVIGRLRYIWFHLVF